MKSLLALTLVLGATVMVTAPAQADEYVVTSNPSGTVTTTTRTYTFAPDHNYVVVDPLTGSTRGVFDINTRTFDGQPLVSGLVLADKVSGQVVATVDANGQVVELSSAPVAVTYLSKLQARRAELDAVISEALTRGDITAARAAELRARLDEVAAGYGQGRVLTYGQALALADSLNAVQEVVVPFAKTVSFTPLLGGRYVIAGRDAVVVGNSVDARRLTLERRVDDEYKAGRLSAKQVARLKQELNEVNMMQAKYTKNGVVSDSKMSKLSMQLDRISTRLDKDVAYINEKRSHIGIRVN